MSKKHKIQRQPWFWGAVVTIFVPLSTLALVLLGYGYTLAVQSVFGISAELVAGSLAEYLQLSSHVIAHLFGAIAKVYQRLDLVKRFYGDFMWWVYVGLAVWAALFLMWLPSAWWRSLGAGLPSRVARMASACQLIEPRWFVPIRRALFWPFAFLGLLAKQLFQWLRRRPAEAWWGLGSLVGVVSFPLLILSASIAALSVLGFAYIWFPYMGLVVGASALQEYVVKPEVCVPVKSRDHRLVDLMPHPPDESAMVGADCVCIQKDGKELARGRLVVSTLQFAILFNPVTGQVQRVPLADTTVYAVGSL